MTKKLEIDIDNPVVQQLEYYGIAGIGKDYKLNYFIQKALKCKVIHLKSWESEKKQFGRTLFNLDDAFVVAIENKKDGHTLITKLKAADYVLAISSNDPENVFNSLKLELLSAKFIQTTFAIPSNIITAKSRKYFDTTHI